MLSLTPTWGYCTWQESAVTKQILPNDSTNQHGVQLHNYWSLPGAILWGSAQWSLSWSKISMSGNKTNINLFPPPSGSQESLLVECQTRDQKVARSNPGRSSRRIFFSWVNFLWWFLCNVPPPRATALARERPWSFCQKWSHQVTPKHAYTLDPMNSEWADYSILA